MFVKLIALLPLLISSAWAGEFKAGAVQPQKANCQIEKNIQIKVDGLATNYSIYDDNARNVKINSCESVKLGNSSFYVFELNSEIVQGRDVLNVLILEFALLDSKTKTLKTVRSETIDQVNMAGDPLNSAFKNKYKVQWGRDSKDARAMLKIEVSEPGEKPFSYLIKLNPKVPWFENVF